jgi:hypothetical protein
MKAAIWDIQGCHQPSSHHTPEVKFIGVVNVRGHPKNLCKLCKLDVEPLAIGHPHEDPLFLKVESGVELWDYLLVPIVPKLHDLGDAMKVTSLNDPVEGGILLLPHIDPLHLDNRLGFLKKHSAISIVMKKSSKPLISALFLELVVARDLTQRHDVFGVNLVVVDHFPVGMNF